MTILKVVPNWEDANEAKRQMLNRFSNLSSVRNAKRTEFYQRLDELFAEFEKKDASADNSVRGTVVS